MTERSKVQELAHTFLLVDQPLGWFDALYESASGDESQIPWAETKPNPHLLTFLRTFLPPYLTKECLVVGCGLGSDAEELARRGYNVTAFDISPTAIDWVKRKYPTSKVDYQVADLFNLPDDWTGAFDFVVEIYTLQALPEPLRQRASAAIANTIAENGFLLTIARGREEGQLIEGPPWPLAISEINYFSDIGLRRVQLSNFRDDSTPPVRHFRALFKKF